MLAGAPLPADLSPWASYVLGAWILISDQVTLSGLGSVIGTNWAGAAPILKAAGHWDDERDALPADLAEALRHVSALRVSWRTCPDCTPARTSLVCSVCGKSYAEPVGRRRSAADDLRAMVDSEGDEV